MSDNPIEVIRVGFTGSRNGLTPQQQDWLLSVIPVGAEVHHGACVGADEMMHCYAMAGHCRVIVHPPINPHLRMTYDPGATWLPAKGYLVRDRDIVDATELLLATPDGPEHDHSGTWYTVRYAVSKHKPVYICYPHGEVETR